MSDRNDFSGKKSEEDGATADSRENQKWVYMDANDENFKVPNSEEPAMRKFQDALKSHYTRLNDQLADEICDLV